MKVKDLHKHLLRFPANMEVYCISESINPYKEDKIYKTTGEMSSTNIKIKNKDILVFFIGVKEINETK